LVVVVLLLIDVQVEVVTEEDIKSGHAHLEFDLN
jgi:hypothetical protein